VPEPDPVQLLRRESLHRGRVFELVHEHIRLPSGREQSLDLVLHPGAVAIAARDTAGRLALVRQYRRAADCWMTEVPAGRLEPGEAPLVAAQRELEEETGLLAGRWTELFAFFAAPGFCSEKLFLFLAEDLAPAGADRRGPDADEELDLVWMRPEDVLHLEPKDAKTLIAALTLLAAQGR